MNISNKTILKHSHKIHTSTKFAIMWTCFQANTPSNACVLYNILLKYVFIYALSSRIANRLNYTLIIDVNNWPLVDVHKC